MRLARGLGAASIVITSLATASCGGELFVCRRHTKVAEQGNVDFSAHC